jgi:hypothetical protein
MTEFGKLRDVFGASPSNERYERNEDVDRNEFISFSERNERWVLTG